MNDVKKKILIVEDHPIVARGLAQLINKQPELTVLSIASSAHMAIESIKKDNPDMVTLDISLKDSNGLELIKDINLEFKHIPILVISMHDENVYAERAIKAGAKGYIMKEKVSKELLKAIYQVLNGKIYLSNKMSSIILNKSIKGEVDNTPVDLLSDRELEVLEYVGEGLTTREIAGKTNLGIKTIETYKSKIKEKLELKNSNQLIKFAVEWLIKNKSL